MSIAIPSVSQVRLGLVLNFAVFFAEVLNDKEAACKLSDTALKAATEQVDDLGDAEFREVKVIME